MASWREDGEGLGAARGPSPLGPARGILLGLALGIPLTAAWMYVAYRVMEWLL